MQHKTGPGKIDIDRRYAQPRMIKAALLTSMSTETR
jgi:hypothetical protein